MTEGCGWKTKIFRMLVVNATEEEQERGTGCARCYGRAVSLSECQPGVASLRKGQGHWSRDRGRQTCDNKSVLGGECQEQRAKLAFSFRKTLKKPMAAAAGRGVDGKKDGGGGVGGALCSLRAGTSPRGGGAPLPAKAAPAKRAPSGAGVAPGNKPVFQSSPHPPGEGALMEGGTPRGTRIPLRWAPLRADYTLHE